MVAKPDSPHRIDVSIIIVFYDDIHELRACVASLSDAVNRCSYEVLIVDNSPKQLLRHTELYIEEAFRVLFSGSNIGLTKATNSAIKKSSGRYCLCLNPDMIARPHSIDDLVDFADTNASAGIVSAKLVHPDGTLQYSCRRFYTIGHILVRRTPLRYILPRTKINAHHLMKDYDHLDVRNVDWVLGSCLLVRTAAMNQVGVMDPRFFMYFEDVDWCFRMHQHDWDVLYCPQITMVHHHRRDSASPGFSRQKREHVMSFCRFHQKHGWRILFRKDSAVYPSKQEPG